MNNQIKDKPESFGIKNSASLEEIRNDETFQFLSEFLEENGIESERREFRVEPLDSNLEEQNNNPEEDKTISHFEYFKIIMSLWFSHMVFSVFARKNYKGINNLFPDRENTQNKTNVRTIWFDPYFQEKNPFLYSSIVDGVIEWISFNKLRNLKQALNNQICLFVFNKFLHQISNFDGDSLPCVRQTEEENIWLYPISLKEFIRVNDPKWNVAQILKINGIQPHIFEFTTSIAGRAISYTRDASWKVDKINSFITLFSRNISIFFNYQMDSVFSWESGEEIQDIVELYLFLENFVMNHTAIHHDDIPYSSLTKDIWFNHNRKYICRFLLEQAEQNKEVPSLDEVQAFLLRQNKDNLNKTNNRESAYMHNTDQIEYDTKQGIYIALEDGEWKWPGKNLDAISRCPFAKSYIKKSEKSKPENALLAMHTIMDTYFLMIIEELNKRGFK